MVYTDPTRILHPSIVLGGECRSARAALLIVCELTSIYNDILPNFILTAYRLQI